MYLEELLPRLTDEHPNYHQIQKEVYMRIAGLRGEKQLKYWLASLDASEWKVVHDLRLYLHGQFVQMDTVVFKRNFCCIIEVKNYDGIIEIHEAQAQCVRVLNGVRSKLTDPISQVLRQEERLSTWLDAQQYFSYPVVSLVAFTNAKSVIQFKGNCDMAQRMVMHVQGIQRKLRELDQFFKNCPLTGTERNALVERLKSMHCPLADDLLTKYEINPEHLKSGVLCPNCRSNFMTRSRSSGKCDQCNYKSKQYFELGLLSYKLFFGDRISNKHFRWWFNIKSASTAAKILSRLKLERSGKRRWVRYVIPDYVINKHTPG
ncbi:MAG: nuclease-related domain-containing protein [Bacilli bacterium]